MEIPAYDLYDLSIPPPAVVPGAMEWPAFCAELMELYHPSTRCKSTCRAMARVLKVLASYDVVTTADLTTTTIARIVRDRPMGQAPATVLALLRCISVACNYAKKTGRLAVSPFAVRALNSWVRPYTPTGKRHLSKLEVRALLQELARDVAAYHGRDRWDARRTQALVATCLYTGLRLGEAMFLEVKDVDMASGVIYVVDRKMHRLKTEKAAQPVIIPIALADILRSWFTYRDDAPINVIRRPSAYVFRNWLRTTPWTAGSVGTRPLDRLQAVGKRAGISRVTFMMIRRTLATTMEETCTDAMIMRVMRHSTPEISRRHYRKADLDNMHSAMDNFGYD